MKLEKEHLSSLLILFLLISCFAVAGYGLHIENKYNECIVEINELNNPEEILPLSGSGLKMIEALKQWEN